MRTFVGNGERFEADVADSGDDTKAAVAGAEPNTFEVDVTWKDRLVVLTVRGGAVDLVTAPQLAESISNAAENRPSAVVVDLTHVEFFASAGMSVLVAAQAQVTPTAKFGVVAEGPATARPLKLVGVDEVVTIYSTIDSAIADLAE